MRLRIRQGVKLVMIGDSITDCERARPVGEGNFQALGSGYVSYIDALIGAVCPERQIRVVNMGNSGDTVRDLAARWDTDVLALQPDWLCVMIGINDVWRQFIRPLLTEDLVTPEEYDATLSELISRSPVSKLILASPFYVEANRLDPMRRRLDEYGQIVRQHASANNALFVDTQAAFDQALNHYHAAALAPDRVHPNHVGHMIIARAFLGALDFDWK